MFEHRIRKPADEGIAHPVAATLASGLLLAATAAVLLVVANSGEAPTAMGAASIRVGTL